MNTYNMKFHAWFKGVLGVLLVAFIASCDDSYFSPFRIKK